MESSPLRGTIGKNIFNLMVVDINDNRLSFWHAFIRNISKLITGVIFDLGYLMIVFTSKGQALHNVIAGCMVTRNSVTNDKS